MIVTILSLFIFLRVITMNIFETGNRQEVIIDSNLTFEESVSGLEFPEEIKNNLKLTDVFYYSFDGKLHKGQVVIHKNLENEIKDIFKQIEKSKFPIDKVIPICKYSWSDSASMADNNTSAFNYRIIKGTKKLSLHSYGIAIDINPFLNPWVKGNEVDPHNAVYRPGEPGTLTSTSIVVQLFKDKGWQWGGDWKSYQDYQHFDKESVIKNY